MAPSPASSTEHKPTGRIPALVLSNFALLLLAFLAFISFLLGHSKKGLIYNSDLVHPFLLVEDVIRDITVLADWHHSPALYVFPDWFLTAAVMTAPVPNGWLPLLYGATNMALYSLVGGALLAGNGSVKIVPVAWTIAAALFLAGWVTVLLDGKHAPFLYISLAAPYIHTGAVLATVTASVLLLSLLGGRSGWWAAIGLAGVVLATSFSDLLFIAWFVAPACAAALLLSRRPRDILLVGLIGCAAIAGWMLEFALHAEVRLQHFAERQSPWTSLAALWDTVTRAAESDVTLLSVTLLTIALLGRTAVLTVASLRRALTPGESMELLLGGICAAAVVAPVATGVYKGAGEIRYMIIIPLIVLVWVVHHILQTMPALWAKRFALLSAAVVLISCIAIAHPAWRSAQRLAEPGPAQRCLEAEGRTAGLGGYETAKLLMLMSNRRIHIIQIGGGGEPYRWNVNERWFTQRADTGTTLLPDFIVVKELDPERLRRSFGHPDRVLTCGGEEIWLYNRPLPLPQ